MKYRQIVEVFRAHEGRKVDRVKNTVEYICQNHEINEQRKAQLHEKIKSLYFRFEQKWQAAYRRQDLFETTNDEWLEKEFELEEYVHAIPVASTSRGRPSKSFEDSSYRTKRRKIDDERMDPKKDTIEKALLGARRTAYNRCDVSMVKVISHILKNRDEAATLSNSHGMMSDEEAFEYFLDCDMTKNVYEQTHKKNPSRFPSYKVIQKMKAICSPPSDSIEKTSTKIKVKLQSLMQHTVERLVQSMNREINKYLDDNNHDFVEMVLLSSWGMDGSTGYSQYHQSFSGINQQDDSDVFSVTTTPIHLYLHSDRKHIFWYNLTPQSVRYCRPIMLEFVKESKQIVIDCKSSIDRELNELVPVKITLAQDKYVLVDFDFVMSMVDGKVLNYITGTSSMQNCPICKATPNAMSSLEELEKGFTPEEEALLYGISPLHAWMRFFECLLHISYRMDFKKWQVSKDLKEQYLKRKQLVQQRLYECFGVRVDQPRQGGAGSSTTGNICRRAFSNPELLSKALDVNEELIRRFWNILIAINCQEPINPEKLDNYCKETYRMYLQLYDWYKIPATVHKVLAHAGDIIIHSPAPLGMLAEEAAECQHKHLKKSRTHHARKTSRVENLSDVFIRAMNSSDPLISSLNLGNRLQNKSYLEYPEAVQSFFVFESSSSSDSSTEQSSIEDMLMDVENINDNFVEDENVHNE